MKVDEKIIKIVFALSRMKAEIVHAHGNRYSKKMLLRQSLICKTSQAGENMKFDVNVFRDYCVPRMHKTASWIRQKYARNKPEMTQSKENQAARLSVCFSIFRPNLRHIRHRMF